MIKKTSAAWLMVAAVAGMFNLYRGAEVASANQPLGGTQMVIGLAALALSFGAVWVADNKKDSE